MGMTGVPGYVVRGVSGDRAFVRGHRPEIYRYFFGFPGTPEMTVGVCLGRFNAIKLTSDDSPEAWGIQIRTQIYIHSLLDKFETCDK